MKKTKHLAEEAFELVCKNHKIEIFEMQVMEDHVYLFVYSLPNYDIWELFKILKVGTSFHIRKKCLSLRKYFHLWSLGYMYRSIINVTAETV